jgi:HSP20 family protein
MVYRTTTLPPLFTLRREVDRLFEDAFGRATAAPATRGAATWSPATDVREEADAYRFELELPGVAPEAVEVTLEKGVLTVRGEKQTASRHETAREARESDVREGNAAPVAASKWHVVERVQGSFKRTFQLPQTVDEERISAAFANGLLTVVVPKAELPKARKIEVRTR